MRFSKIYTDHKSFMLYQVGKLRANRNRWLYEMRNASNPSMRSLYRSMARQQHLQMLRELRRL